MIGVKAEAPVAVPEQPPRTSRLEIRHWPLIAGLLCLVLPTLTTLARTSWSGSAGAHGPIVLATGIWLFWRERAAFSLSSPRPALPVGLLLVPLIVLYVLARITSLLPLECASLYALLLLVGYLEFGTSSLRALWFPCVYMLFLITPPDNWLFVATNPLKMHLSETSVGLLSALGFDVGYTGTMIQVDGYQLLVATACSGVYSMIGITAISAFYIYLMRGDERFYALALVLLAIPVAVVVNLVRIIVLILVTHWFGEEVGQGLAHEATGLALFIVAILLLMMCDGLLYPIVVRHRIRREHRKANLS